MTEWRAIQGFSGYEVSEDGQVRSWRRPGPPVTLRQYGCHGYLKVSIMGDSDGKHYNRNVHVLVALAFIGERPEGMQVCHYDGDKTNNHLPNLRYGTAEENFEDRRRHGTDGGWRKSHCLRGHEYTEENTKHSPKGRSCRTCYGAKQAGYTRAYRERQQANAA